MPWIFFNDLGWQIVILLRHLFRVGWLRFPIALYHYVMILYIASWLGFFYISSILDQIFNMLFVIFINFHRPLMSLIGRQLRGFFDMWGALPTLVYITWEVIHCWVDINILIGQVLLMIFIPLWLCILSWYFSHHLVVQEVVGYCTIINWGRV